MSLPFSKRLVTSVLLFLFFFSIYTFTMSGWIQYGDEMDKYRVAQSIVDRHELSYRPTQQRGFKGLGGRNYSAYELGQTALEIPLYVLGRVVYHYFPTPDINLITIPVVGLFNPILTALTVVLLLHTSLVLGFGYGTSLGLALLFGLATIAWPYSKGYTREPVLALFILLCVYTLVRYQQSRAARWLLTAGFVGGWVVFVKFIHVAIIPVLLAYIALILFQEHRGSSSFSGVAKRIGQAFLWFLLPGIALVAIQVVYALMRFGTPMTGIAGVANPVGHTASFLAASTPVEATLGLLFSMEKSILVYTPPALLFPFAWWVWFKRDRSVALLILGLVAVESSSSIFRLGWDGGGWWGPRYVVQMTPLLILALGALETSFFARRAGRLTLGLLGALGVAVQLVGVLTSDREYMDITGQGPQLLGQLDFLRHAALDSLVLSLSPAGLPLQVNPFALVLLVVAVPCGLMLVRQLKQPTAEFAFSARGALVLSALVLLVEFGAMTAWVLAPFPQVRAAKGNTRLVAGDVFFAAGRTREAAAMYGLALDYGTAYEQEASALLEQLMPRQPGDVFSALDLMRQVEAPEQAIVTADRSVALKGDSSLKLSVPGSQDATVTTQSDWIPIAPGATYEISGWIKTENIYGAGYGVVGVYEDDGVWQNPRKADAVLMDETGGWRLFQKRITTLPTTRRLMLSAGLWKTYGTLWLDDLQLARVTNP